MANPVEFSVEVASLPANFQGTLAEFVALLPSLLTVLPDEEWTSFIAGNTEPTSNVGPWLKTSSTGAEWYVWNATTSAYVPLTVSLPTIPDGSISGAALEDETVTEAKLAPDYVDRIDGAISALQTLVASGVGKLAVAEKNVSQSYVYAVSPTPATPIRVSFGSELVDVAGRYDPTNSRYLASEDGWYWVNVALYVDTASDSTPLGITTELKATIDGTTETLINAHVSGDNSTQGRTYSLQGVVRLTAGQYVEIFYAGELASGALTVSLVNDARKSRLQIWKVA